MASWKGKIRERCGTFRTALALFHPHLLRMRLRGNPQFRRYARPVFERYIQSLCDAVTTVDYVEMLQIVGADPAAIHYQIPVLAGYVGLSAWERVALGTLARRFDARPMFEIGTAAGSTAVLLAQNTRQTVFTLDLSDDTDQSPALTQLASDDQVIANRTRASFLREFPQTNVEELLGDSATYDFRPFGGQIGLFFVDGAHSYEYVRSDTARAAYCCAEDGVIVWHDFGSSRDVSRWLNELATSGPRIYAIAGTTLALSRDIAAIRRQMKCADVEDHSHGFL